MASFFLFNFFSLWVAVGLEKHLEMYLKLSLVWQVRYPVLLTPTEKQMAREVCIAFRQAVSPFEPFEAYK